MSSEKGRKDSSLERQRALVEEHVTARGWDLVAVYEEVAPRGDSGGQPALISLLSEVERFDRVVIPALRMLKHSASETLDIVRRLRRAGVELVSLAEQFDTGEASGAAVPRVLAFAAAREMAREARHGWQAENLRKPGFSPATVIDVGVATGTPALYRAFPEAHFVLIDPLEEYVPHFERICSEHDAEYVLTAVGAKQGRATIDVDRIGPIFSSMLPRFPTPPPDRLETREIPVTTLDALLEERRWQGPFGLKLDVEGFEREVIEGATRLLEGTQFVIAELSLIKRFGGSYTFAEFIALMDARGFRLCDIVDLPKVSAFSELKYTNAMFRPIGDR